MRTTKNETINDELTKKDILALDIATHTGYYSLHEGGTWNFTESKRKHNNKQHKDFRDTLMAFIQKYDIKQIVAEDVNVNNHFTDMRKLCEFRGILKEVCDELDLPEPEFINVATLKKWTTGDGRADKKKMMEFCYKRYGITPIDDNHSDAICIFYYYARKYRLN